MKTFGALLLTPWIASSRSSRWLALIVVLLCAATLAVVVHAMQGRDLLIVGALAWCAAIGCWCLLVAGNVLFVARDATALCLPSLRRIANASVIVHAALFVLLPALALGALTGHWLFWLVGFSLAAAACMLFLLLPAIMVVAATLGTSIALNLVHPHKPSPHAMLILALTSTLLSVVLASWRWLRLQRQVAPLGFGLNVPLIWSLRLQSIHGFARAAANPDLLMARASRGWLAPTPDLHAMGPVRPVRAIRMALGRNLMPQTWSSVLRQMGFSLAFIGVFTVAPLAAQMGNHDFRVLMQALFLPHPGSLGLPVIIASVVAALALLVFPMPVRARWSAGAAELPMLALLPGLGDPIAARRHVLRATLYQTLVVALVEFAVLCALGAWVHQGLQAGVLTALSVACTAALAAACIIATLACRPLSVYWRGGLGCVLPLLVALAMACAFSTDMFGAWAWSALAAALVVLLLALAGLCLRGWRAFQRLPHPFLAGGA